MKNKKGFTLVELLVVIGILGILIAIAVPSAIGISNRIKAKMYDSKVKTIEVAAGLWAEDHKDDCIKDYDKLDVKTLVSGGYLKADKGSDVTNPNPNGEISKKNLNDYTMSDLDININMVCESSKLASQRILQENELQETEPDFGKGAQYCNDNSSSCSSSTKNGAGLFETQDNKGSSYYFRGVVENNFVQFAERMWRVMRINGDGSIRLVLNGNTGANQKFNLSSLTPKVNQVGFTYNNSKSCTNDSPCEVIYDNLTNKFSNDNFVGTDSEIKKYLETWYTTNLAEYDDKIVAGYFCNDSSYGSGTESNFSYGAYKRICQDREPTLICPDPKGIDGTMQTYGGIYRTKIGLLSADEVNMAGIACNTSYVAVEPNYLYNGDVFWTMSPDSVSSTSYGFLFYYTKERFIAAGAKSSSIYVVPVINLKPHIELYTDSPINPGTETNPYKVK